MITIVYWLNPCSSQCGPHWHDLEACWKYTISALPRPDECESPFEPDPKERYVYTAV